jgi:sporulation protein YlmC with PRC-barrel domain
MDKDNLNEKKLRGSGGYAIARISDKEQKMANLGGPELFLAGIGRLENERFVKYYCNKCEKDYQGSPNIDYENPNEDLGENITLVEKGEYKCKACNYTIAQYRKFNDLKENGNLKIEEEKPQEEKAVQELSKNNLHQSQEKEDEEDGDLLPKATESPIPADKETTSSIESHSQIINLAVQDDYTPINKIIGMPIYDSNAHLIGKISEIGLRKTLGQAQFCLKITDPKEQVSELPWNDISKIGDIAILQGKGSYNEADKRTGREKTTTTGSTASTAAVSSPDQSHRICPNCNYKNDPDSLFCEECGKKIE